MAKKKENKYIDLNKVRPTGEKPDMVKLADMVRELDFFKNDRIIETENSGNPFWIKITVHASKPDASYCIQCAWDHRFNNVSTTIVGMDVFPYNHGSKKFHSRSYDGVIKRIVEAYTAAEPVATKRIREIDERQARFEHRKAVADELIATFNLKNPTKDKASLMYSRDEVTVRSKGQRSPNVFTITKFESGDENYYKLDCTVQVTEEELKKFVELRDMLTSELVAQIGV